MSKPVYVFGEFEFDVGRRLLSRGHERVPLGSRATDILVSLLERPGVMIGAAQLMQKIWPDTYVDRTNLRVHIGMLRKALGRPSQGSEFIENLPGAGYRFAIPVTEKFRLPGGVPSSIFRPPPPPVGLVGRDVSIQDLVADLPRHRLLTLVGPPGVGKTSVALAVANQVFHNYENGVCFLDVAAVSGEARVQAMLGYLLRLPSTNYDSERLAETLSEKELLLVFDNCEQYVDEVAHLVEFILQNSPRTSVLATSREPLGAKGEWIRRLMALDVPASKEPLSTLDEALEYSAVRLFVERAQARSLSFQISTSEISSVVALCQRLDGLPLAIELAATRVDALPLHEIARQLQTSVNPRSSGPKTAEARHKTLAAALDWSFELLSEMEKQVLVRLAVFQSPFTREAAMTVSSDRWITPLQVMESLASLTAKSMVLIEPHPDGPFYRLLETTRSYARKKHSLDPHDSTVWRRYAAFHRDQVLESAKYLEDALT